jgi:CBS domain-containing protein
MMVALNQPVIRSYMTPVPYCIEATEPLTHAKRMMRHLGVRHLPVCRDGQLVGVLSERGVEYHGSSEAHVERAMVPNPYRVAPETPLRRVAAEMASYRTDSAVVVDENGTVAGIFTTSDALDALVDIIPRPALAAV